MLQAYLKIGSPFSDYDLDSYDNIVRNQFLFATTTGVTKIISKSNLQMIIDITSNNNKYNIIIKSLDKQLYMTTKYNMQANPKVTMLFNTAIGLIM